jgi:hypothetical protein
MGADERVMGTCDVDDWIRNVKSQPGSVLGRYREEQDAHLAVTSRVLIMV